MALHASTAPALAQTRAADASVPRELATALVNANAPLSDSVPTVTVGRVPDGFPAAVPLPAGGHVLGGARFGAARLAVVAVDDVDPAAARARYVSELGRAGWRAAGPPPWFTAQHASAFPGFLPSAPSDPEADALRCSPDGDAVLVGTRPRDDGRPGTLLRLLTGSPGRAARCRATAASGSAASSGVRVTGLIREVRGDPQAGNPLPPLPPPPGAVVRMMGASSGSDNFASQAVVTGDTALRVAGTAFGPAALVAYYGTALETAGWRTDTPPTVSTEAAARIYSSPPGIRGERWVATLTAVRRSARRMVVSVQALVAGEAP